MIPQRLQNIEIIKVSTKNISPDVAKVIGAHEKDVATILISQVMRVNLSSPTFEIHSVGPIVKEVSYEVNSPTHWIWTIVAPEAEGYHRINLEVYLGEGLTEPSWIRSYQIEVVLPTSTPAPTHTPQPTQTPTSSPTPTPIPPPTFTPTPTQTVGEKIVSVIIQGSDKILIALIPLIITWVGGMIGVVVGILKRHDEIQKLKIKLNATTVPKTKAALQRKIAELEAIRWWQFWKWR